MDCSTEPFVMLVFCTNNPSPMKDKDFTFIHF